MKSGIVIASDILFVASVICLGLAGFFFLNRKQAFAGLSFGIKNLFERIFNSRGIRQQTFSEYLKEQEERSKRKPTMLIFVPLIIGLVLLAAAIITAVIACNGN